MGASAFWPMGDGRFATRHDMLGDASPVYIVARTARDLIDNGTLIELPIGWSVDQLRSVAWRTGRDGATVNIGGQHATDFAMIAHTLLDHHRNNLSRSEIESIQHMLSVIEN